MWGRCELWEVVWQSCVEPVRVRKVVLMKTKGPEEAGEHRFGMTCSGKAVRKIY